MNNKKQPKKAFPPDFAYNEGRKHYTNGGMLTRGGFKPEFVRGYNEAKADAALAAPPPRKEPPMNKPNHQPDLTVERISEIEDCIAESRYFTATERATLCSMAREAVEMKVDIHTVINAGFDEKSSIERYEAHLRLTALTQPKTKPNPKRKIER